MNFYALRGYNRHKNYWENRKIDWRQSYTSTWDHPHRMLIIRALSEIPFMSLFELGCGSGANLIAIAKNLPGKQLGGIDINPDAIDEAKQMLKNSAFRVGPADDVMMSDKSVDVILTDMLLIYTDWRSINNHVKEIKRLARNYIILCEFHTDSWWNRMAIKFNTGYRAYDYTKLLEKHGFYNIQMYKIKPEDWPGGGLQEKFGYIIMAKVPKY